MTAVPMTPDELAKVTAIQTALAAMKSSLNDAENYATAISSNADALMTILKPTRIDAYNAAFGTKSDGVTLGGECKTLRGHIMQAHYRASALLQTYYTDAATVVQSGPGR